MIYKDWESLEKDIIRKTREVTQDCQNFALNRLEENLRRFYETDEPVEYVRTHHLEHSGKQKPFTITSNGGFGEIYIDQSDFYSTGTYQTPWVFEDAELPHPPSNMLGIPHFWEDTMDDIQNTLMPNAFGRIFKR